MKQLTIFCLIILTFSCTNSSQKTENSTPIPSNLSGKELAHTYCASCHNFPEPNLLDKSTWQNGVLPKMYARLGLEEDSFALFAGMNDDDLQIIANSGIYPESPMIAKEDWAKIVKYYLDNAPIKPQPQDAKFKPKIGLKGFEISNLNAKKNEIPAVTLVKFNPTDKSLFIGYRGNFNFIKKYDLNFRVLDSIAITSPVSDIVITNNSLKYLLMGKMDPNDQKKGSYSNYNLNTKAHLIIKDSLQRPVQITFGDLNQDKIEDYVICNFGNELGKLAWYDGKTNKENILNSVPGARNAIITDLNNDKLPDIAVLMTQAKEQILFYFNKGAGVFEEKSVLTFPPVYGSSFFEMVDFNKDGFKDILYTNGDNADLSISLKKYHGVRIFLNDGKNNFEQSYFYPMYGASKAKAFDFDLDGDLDIAAISFFTAHNQKPNEGFLFFKNLGDNLRFEITSIKEANKGKWMVMDIDDMDLDGDKDIILGSFYLKNRSEIKNNKNSLPDVLLLKNVFK